MSFRFQADEAVSDGIRRMAREQIDRAVAEIGDRDLTTHERVHQVRKRCKKVRAIARLARPALGDDYSRINAHFRDLARGHSDLRDAHALVEGVDELRDAHGEEIQGLDLGDVRAAFQARRDRLAAATDVLGLFESTRSSLLEARRDVAAWHVDDDGFAAIAGGLRRVYARGRKAMVVARENPGVEIHHEWRKRAKYLRYQIRMLRNLWTEPMQALEDELHQLCDLLGDDHDVAVVHETVEGDPNLKAVAGMTDYLELLARRSHALRDAAHVLGSRVHAEKPGRFVDRMERYALASGCPS